MKKVKNDNSKIIKILFILLILSLSFLLMSNLNIESDYYWHISAGKHMIKNGSILTHDIFSWAVYNKYWISHEWLFECILYMFNYLTKNIYILPFILIVVLFYFLFKEKDYLKNIPFSIFWFSLSTILMYFIQLRPQMFSYIFFAITTYFLYDLYNNEYSRKIYILPLVSIVWANIHGGSSNLVYILPIIFIISTMFEFNSEKIVSKKLNIKQLKKLLIVIVLSILLLNINPHGIKILFYPYENMLDKTMLSTISEWQPSNLNDISHYPYFLLVLIILITLLISKRKIRLVDLMLFLFSLFLGLKGIRFWPYLYISATSFIYDYVAERKKDYGTEIVLIILISSFLLLGICNIYNKSKNTIIDKNTIKYLKRIKPKKIYNYYDYGGYLIYNNIKVYIDGRADLYSKYNYKDYFKIYNTNYGFKRIIKDSNFDYYLVPTKSNIDYYLNSNKKYQKIIEKKKYRLYKTN